MTRWARANNIHKHKPSNATPWDQLRAGGGGEAALQQQTKSQSRSFSSSRLQDPASHKLQQTLKTGRKAKKRNDTDVNGFLEYLKETGQKVPGDAVEEVATAFKKDQRRENRRIKRQNTKKSNIVCFKCRKPGHGLSDCPEAEVDEEMGSGICYRCGSTEHEMQRCRAKVDPALGDYPYAKCFICGQMGHLSRSCPDNPKGLYAAGGCCRVCGSVEHFQKDCPEHQASANAVTLSRLSNLISADHEEIHTPVRQTPAKKAKVVLF